MKTLTDLWSRVSMRTCSMFSHLGLKRGLRLRCTGGRELIMKEVNGYNLNITALLSGGLVEAATLFGKQHALIGTS